MAVGDKKEMKAVLKLNPWAEMKKHQKVWFQENFSKNRKVQLWSYEKKATLDPREWDANKLQKAIAALVRYEAVLFASRTEEWIKKIEKSKDKDKTLKEAQAKLPGYFTELYKQMTLKMDKAVDELVSGKADNAKSLAQGKEAFKKFDKIDMDGMYSDPVDSVLNGLGWLRNANDDADDEKEKARDIKEAGKNIGDAKKMFAQSAKEIENVVKFLMSTGTKLLKDKKADADIQKFGATIMTSKNKGMFAKFMKRVSAFEKAIGEADKAFGKGEMSEREINVMESTFKKFAGLESDVKALEKSVRALHKDFAKVEKKLK